MSVRSAVSTIGSDEEQYLYVKGGAVLYGAGTWGLERIRDERSMNLK